MKVFVNIAMRIALVECMTCTATIIAATKAQEQVALQRGLAYLHNTQQPEGYWAASGHEQAATGAAAFTLLSQYESWGTDTPAYEATVQRAIGYLLSTASVSQVNIRNDGVAICPPGITSCQGVYWYGNGEAVYTTALVARALAMYGVKAGSATVATTAGPLAGMTWTQIAQAITNSFAANQSTSRNGNRDGGWLTLPGTGESDSINTYWATLALVYDETLGATTPVAVKNGLKVWLGNVQSASGGICSQPGAEPCDHANTGGWLLGMKFAGYEVASSQVQAALAFLNANWHMPADKVWYGNFGHPLAMAAIYDGLDATAGMNPLSYINNPLTDCGASANGSPTDESGEPHCTWSDDYVDWLVKNQRADGSWAGYSYWTDTIATSWYLNIIGAIHVPIVRNQGTPDGTSPRHRPTGDTPQMHTSTLVAPSASGGVQRQASKSGKPKGYTRKGVTALAVNRAGTALASGSTDKAVRVWSVATGLQSVSLTGSLGLPTGVVFSPGGSTLSSVARDSLVRVWDAVSGTQIGTLTAHEQPIRAVAVSPDAQFLASTGEETRIMLWDLTARKLAHVLYGPKDFVNSVAFSPDSHLLATAGEDARIIIFDVTAAKAVHTLLGHAGPINTVAFNPDGSLLASAGQDTVIHLWDAVSYTQRQMLAGHSQPIRTVVFSPDGKLLASGGEDSRIILWDIATGAIKNTLMSSAIVNALVFDPKGRFLGSASEAGDITLWDVVSGAKLLTIAVPTAR